MVPLAYYPPVVFWVIHLYAIRPVIVETPGTISSRNSSSLPACVIRIRRKGIQREWIWVDIELEVCPIEERSGGIIWGEDRVYRMGKLAIAPSTLCREMGGIFREDGQL